NDNDPIAPGTITGTYGVDAFGTVTTGPATGSLAGSATINDALSHTSSRGVANVLPGTYSQLVDINRKSDLTLRGPQAGVSPVTGGRSVGSGLEAVLSGAGAGVQFRGAVGSVTVEGLAFGGGAAVVGGYEDAAIILRSNDPAQAPGSTFGDITIR